MEAQRQLLTTTISTPFIFYTTVPGIPENAQDALQRASVAFEKGDHAATEQAFRDACEYAPHTSQLLSNLGAWLCAQHNVHEGVTLLHNATSQEHACAGAWYNMGTLLLGHNMIQQALPALERAVELDPESTAMLNNLGVALFHLKQLDRAYLSFEGAIHHNKDFDLAYHNIGMIHYERHEYAHANHWFEQTLQLNTRNHTTLNSLGCSLFLEGKTSPALQAFRKAVSLQPTFQMPYYNVGFIALQYDLLNVQAQA